MVVEVEGKMAPIVERICMDQRMIDVTDILGTTVSNKVLVYDGKGKTSVDHIADVNKTINYEIVCVM